MKYKINRKRALFLIFLVSLPFWLAFNFWQGNLENYFFSQNIQENPPQFLISDIHNIYRSAQKPTLSAEAAILAKFENNEVKTILFEKNPEQKMPIASITKLMTAVVAEEFYDLGDFTIVSQKAVSQEENFGNLISGEKLSVKNLIMIMLVESSNDASQSLAEIMGEKGFVTVMNLKSRELGMKNSRFYNPSGLDPKKDNSPENYSTPRDLLRLSSYILSHPFLIETLGRDDFPLYLENGKFHHTLKNTNNLLKEIPNSLGGKTGYTERAGKCLIMFASCKQGGILVSAVLGSEERFEDIKKLIEYARAKYQCN